MDDALLGQVTESPRLPSLPAVALEVIDLVQRPDVDVEDLARAIGNDPALSAKVLRTVNSSFYAQARTISTIEQAIVIGGPTGALLAQWREFQALLREKLGPDFQME